MNAVTEADGHPAAVLIRALQPLDGIALMKKRRAPDGRAIDEHDLCRGPGNLTRRSASRSPTTGWTCRRAR